MKLHKILILTDSNPPAESWLDALRKMVTFIAIGGIMTVSLLWQPGGSRENQENKISKLFQDINNPASQILWPRN